MRRALVVVDMQNDFITGSLANTEAQLIVPNVCDLIRDTSFSSIVVTRDAHTKDYLKTQEGRNLPVKHCILHSDGWKLNPKVAQAIADRRNSRTATIYEINKPTFGSLVLSAVLRDELKDYDELVFCGVCTDICVISNVMIAKATLPEIEINVVAYACAGVTPEKHQTALEAMKACQVGIIQ